MQPSLTISAASHAGRKKQNQDALLVSSLLPLSRAAHQVMQPRAQMPWQLFGVADGVSACHKPKQASHMAVHVLAQQLLAQHDNMVDFDDESIALAIAHAMQATNDALYFTAPYSHLPELLSTLSAMIVFGSTAHLVHTGDSRIYRFTGEKYEVLTKDHRGKRGLDKGALTAALGADTHLNLQHEVINLHMGEIYIIMTDGVYEHVAEDELTLLLRATKDDAQKLDALPEKLCRIALDSGSSDNLSCVCVKVLSANLQDAKTKLKQPVLQLELPPALNVGDTLDGMVVSDVLHNSPRSRVYLATNAAGEKRIIKVPSMYFKDDTTYLRDFLKEEKIGLSFDHDSLLKFYPKPAGSKYLYHLTDYLDGRSLRVFLDQHAPLNLGRVHQLAERIGVGLRAMHRKYLLHQDIKPENIILGEGGEVTLIDYGSVGSLILKDALTPPVGDLNYCAPEYYTGAPKGISSDIFSLGVVVYEMLTGKLPFTVKQISSGEKLTFADVRSHCPSLPAWLNAVLVRALHSDPEARYQAISEFISELDPAHHAQKEARQPLIKSNPLLLWQGVSAILFVVNMVLLWLLFG